MTIKTKFNTGDKVYYIGPDKAVHTSVVGYIKVEVINNTVQETYKVNGSYVMYSTQDLYKTVDEMYAQLQNNIIEDEQPEQMILENSNDTTK